jgi:hypothetical protein
LKTIFSPAQCVTHDCAKIEADYEELSYEIKHKTANKPQNYHKSINEAVSAAKCAQSTARIMMKFISNPIQQCALPSSLGRVKLILKTDG